MTVICMTALLVKEGHPRALYESRGFSSVSLIDGGSVYVQMCFMWYIVHVMCSLSIRLRVVDLLLLGSRSGLDKGKAPA